RTRTGGLQFGVLASTASAGSFCLFCENGEGGLPAVTTATPRALGGVVTHADSAVSPGTPTGAFSELHRSTPGDPRGSSQNNLVGESLGGYVYAAATRTYGAAVWNDTRNAADCPAIDAWRQALASGDTR